ncbi:MAG: cbb3-type cytochrome c oxidase subunit 3 [Deltaproteobacteria bacterium]|nr:cbb3-type cytochrome c oxidase subunit 3 [Deltaproteobacteria bacterium]
MSASALLYILFTAALGAVFAGIVAYYYGKRRFERVEAPKFRMLEDDETPPGPSGGVREG